MDKRQNILAFRNFVMDRLLKSEEEGIFFEVCSNVAFDTLEDSVSIHARCIETPVEYVDDLLMKLKDLTESLEKIKKMKQKKL